MSSQKVVRSLVCGSCKHCKSGVVTRRKETYCNIYGTRVMSYEPFCDFYEWSGCDVMSPYPPKLRGNGRKYLVA